MSDVPSLVEDDVVEITSTSGQVQKIAIPGYRLMYNKKSKRNKALTLKAMAQLEWKHFVDGDPTGTKDEILVEVRAMGSTLGENSANQVLKNINTLIQEGHVVRRGGSRTPWVTVYVYPAFAAEPA